MPIRINDTSYGDGGVGWNNPSEEAISEAHNKWPGRPIGCLVSLGTGLEDALRLEPKQDSQTVARKIFGIVAPGYSFELSIAEFCVNAVTSCERVHRRLSQNPERFIDGGNYFRLNVPQSMSTIGLEEWQKLDEIVALAKDYLDDGDVRRKKQEIARVLLSRQLQR